MDRVRELRAQIQACRGRELRAELSALARVYRLFLGNHRELREYLAAHSSGAAMVELWRDDRREEFELFLDEVDRLLHNFVAGAATLADHTRRVWTKHAPAPLEVRAEYERRVLETFTESELAAFVKGLRNFTLHRQLPVARGQLSWTQGMPEPVSRVYLARDHLLEGDWKELARSYLDNAPEKIDLAEVIEQYAGLVVGFNGWLGVAFVGGHLAAFDELRLLEDELQAELRPKLDG